jgi:ABC-type multidrug transport system fused ATPase/permease subunit
MKPAIAIWGGDPRGVFFVIVATVFGAFMEAVGLVLIPILASIASPDQGLLRNYLPVERSGVYSDVDLVSGLVPVLVLFFIAKTIVSSAVIWIQSSYVYKTKQRLSQKVYEYYLNQNYEESIQTSTSTKISRVSTEMHALTTNYLYPTVQVFSEVLVFVSMVSVAILLEPLAAISSMLIVGVALIIIDLITKRKLQEWGRAREIGEQQKIALTQQVFDVFKEIKVARASRYFGELFRGELGKLKDVEARELALSQMPRLWLEAVAVLALGVALFASSIGSTDRQGPLTTLVIFGLVGLRLMPSANRIIVSVQKMRYAAPSLPALLDKIGPVASPASNELQTRDVSRSDVWRELRFNDVSYSYGTTARVLSGVSMVINRGQYIGIIGPSGSGKSTLLDLALGLLTPTGGLISLDGRPLADVLGFWQSRCAYVPQNPLLINDTVAKNVALGVDAENVDQGRVVKALESAGLAEFSARLDQVIGERGVGLSGGQKQRLSIARALYYESDVLFFDEATSALDSVAAAVVTETIAKLSRQGGRTIIIVSHQGYLLRGCDKVIDLGAV